VKKNFLAHMALFCVALIYAANYIIAKDVMSDHYLEPYGFILMRVVSACILFQLVHLILVREKLESYKDHLYMIMCALFGVAINQLAFFKGLQLTSPINASVIIIFIPIAVMVFSFLLKIELIKTHKVLGIIISACGTLWLILQSASDIELSNVKGDFLIFVNAVSYGLYLVLIKNMMVKYNPFTVLKWVFTYGLVMVLPFGYQEVLEADWSNFPQHIYLSIFYVLFFTTFLTYLFNAYALKKVNPTVAGVYVYLQPVLTTIIALLLAKDILTVSKTMAAIIIMLGLFISTRRKKPAAI